MTSKADYGIDAPGIVRTLLAIGVGSEIVALLILGKPLPFWGYVLSSALTLYGLCFFLTGFLMWVSSRILKLKFRDKLLSLIDWKGDETVLDVGTGKGLLLIGAAKKLTTGKAIGVDIWKQSDLSSNSIEATKRNIELEGVAHKAEVQTMEIRSLQFPDGHFDVILSNLCLHNISTPEGRTEACKEIARVLKKGGVALLSDFQKTKEYETTFRELGLEVKNHGKYWGVFPPEITLQITK